MGRHDSRGQGAVKKLCFARVAGGLQGLLGGAGWAPAGGAAPGPYRRAWRTNRSTGTPSQGTMAKHAVDLEAPTYPGAGQAVATVRRGRRGS